MKESPREGLASHPDPESCVDPRKGFDEALTGAHAGQPSSCEIRSFGMPTLLAEAEGNMVTDTHGEFVTDPAQSKTLHMRENSLPGNREIPISSLVHGAGDRSEKVNDRTSDVHEVGKSDECIVPKKLSNKGMMPAEMVEGRRSTKGNTSGEAASRTQSRGLASSALERVRKVAQREKRMRFTALLHYVTIDLLRDSFFALQRNASPGVDEVTWQQYQDGFEERLVDLHRRVHSGTYRALPSRRVFIPKADGRERPLGIASLEDKIVQRAVVTVLEAIYEEDFLGLSYGFRPGRSQHDALDALWVGLARKPVRWILDADIQGFFDTVNHEWLLKFIEHRVADPRILRLICKWLRAGVSEQGTWSKTTVGTPQGSVASPFLANVYLYYVFDLWAHQWRKKHATGEVIVVRYADDFVVGFQRVDEARRFLADLRERLKRFGLCLHANKTRLIEFGRYALVNRQQRGLGKPETFDFLGFTHVCGKPRNGEGYLLKRKTVKARLRAKLQTVKAMLMKHRHAPVPKQGKWLGSVVRGYYLYHAISGNLSALEAFRTQVIRSWLFALRRRSQRSRLPWTRYQGWVKRWIPSPHVMHPYPNVRFDAKHPR